MTFEDGKEDSLSAEVMNAFVEQLKKQVEFCATIKGYIQLSAGSLIGIRDVFQALEGYMIWQPEAAAPRCLKRSASPIPPGGALANTRYRCGRARHPPWICAPSSIRVCG